MLDMNDHSETARNSKPQGLNMFPPKHYFLFPNPQCKVEVLLLADHILNGLGM
jgi:hypothetical protein